MQADVVKLRQLGAIAKLVERLVKELGAGVGHARQLLRKTGLRRVEVGTCPLHHAGGCVQIGAHALAKAQFASAAHFGRHQASVEKRQAYAQGVEFGVVAVGVANVGHIAGGPVGHGVCLLGDVMDV